MKTLGQRIHQKRTELGLTQEELGKQLGVKRQAICKWEKGEVTEFKRSYILTMATIFHCDPAWLMGFDKDSNVYLTYNAPGKEPVTAIVDKEPIMGVSSKRSALYRAALNVKTENLDVAIDLLKSLS